MNIKTDFDGTHTHLVCPICNSDHFQKTGIEHNDEKTSIAYCCSRGHDMIIDFENYKGRINVKVISG